MSKEIVEFELSDSEEDKHEVAETISSKEQARKRARLSPLHENYVTPLSFLVDAVEAKDNFRITSIGESFGKNNEAYARVCYEDIAKSIFETWKTNRKQEKKKAMLFVIRGSSGIGKSVFLAFAIMRLKKFFPNITLCYAPKSAKSVSGIPDVNEIHCKTWQNGTKTIEGSYCSVREQLVRILDNLDLIVMDGCSMPFVDVERFKGTVLVAGSPSLYVKNLKDAIFDHCDFTMPPLEDDEALSIAKMPGIGENVVVDNLRYMKGITRYLLKPGAARNKVHSAVEEVNATSITKLVSMQSLNRGDQSVAVHSLVLWKVGDCYRQSPRFELVSRYAEHLVATKLATETLEDLKSARRNMAPLSGAEGYAGALFEAYAVRTMQAGGDFEMRRLDGTNTDTTTILIPSVTTDPIVVESNTLSCNEVSRVVVRVSDKEKASNEYYPRLLWPITTNFPAFDCFYFHTNGRVFALQITIAMVQDLKNSGAASAKRYLDEVFGNEKPAKYAAVFVVPKDRFTRYQAQKFTGNVNKKAADFGRYFDQWVLGV